MQIYVDGSFGLSSAGDVRSGWSLCILCQVETEWLWAGFLAATCGAGGDASLQVPVRSAFETELAALVHALAWCVAFPCPAALFFFDSESAGAIAGGTAAANTSTALSEAAASLLHLLVAQRRPPAFCHVRAHQGQPLNEFCDGAAKAAAKAFVCTPLPDTLCQAQAQQVLPWLWTAIGVSFDLPSGCSDGGMRDAARDIALPSGLPLSQVLPSDCTRPTEQVQLDFRFVTYNVLSLSSVAQRESVAAQLKHRSCSLIGFQEARQDLAGRHDAEHYFVIASPAQQGQLGVQAWFARSIPLGWAGQTPLFWDSRAFSVLVQTPRQLLVLARAGSLKFAVLVGHSPAAKDSVDVRRLWWQSLTAALRRAPPSFIPLVLLDANAKERSGPAHEWEESNDFSLSSSCQSISWCTREQWMRGARPSPPGGAPRELRPALTSSVTLVKWPWESLLKGPCLASRVW